MHPLVTTEWLEANLGDPHVVTADVRWRPNPPNYARDAYTEAHIPGAVFLDLDDHLSDRSDPNLMRGRHPLPAPDAFAQVLAERGIGKDTTVIAYDDAFGSIAGRLWWMLRWIGHERTAVLDGGIIKWRAESRSVESGPPKTTGRHPHPIEPQPNDDMLLPTKSSVADALKAGMPLLDARDPARFRGETEPIDKFAGHITGAANAPFTDNLQGDDIKTYRSPEELRAHYERKGLTPDRPVACYCGSGVSACHNVLAITLAGLPMPRLYPGSWSEWSLDPEMPTTPER